MPDLESIITAAVASANPDTTPEPEIETAEEIVPEVEPAIVPDPVEGEEKVIPDPADTSEEAKAAKEAAKVPEIDPATGKPKVEAKPVEKTQVEKDLEELGLKAPKEGERENRLPFSRVKKITENYGKKLTERHQAELTPLKTEVETLRTTAATVKNVDRLIATDADRYITMLAGIHPEYKKFLQGGKVDNDPAKVDKDGKPAENKAVSALGPRPVADHEFADGTMGFTPAQHDKLLDWVAAKAKEEALTEARAEMDKRFKPMDDQRKNDEDYTKRVEGVKAEGALIRDMYGDDVVKKYEAQIVAHMKKNPTMSPRQAAREIIMPALQADRNKMRTELLVETGERPAAAKKTPAAAAKADGEEHEPTTIEGIIAKSIQGLKR